MQIKHRLLAHCQQYVNQRLDTVTRAMEEIRQALDEETKSTAGDKHETGRAMMQLEQEKLSTQMAEVQQLQKVLNRIKLEDLPPGIGEGSLVLTSQGNYFLAISAGKVEMEGKLFYLISLASPIGLALTGKKVGELVSFWQQGIGILEVH